MLRIINLLTFAVMVLILSFQTSCLAQDSQSKTEKKRATDNIYMTWNKNTPESEMNDDIKALAEKGVTITYSDVKRNDKNEITAIKVSYSDQNGNSGSMALNNQKPINTIKFYKQGDELGFGNPSDNGMMAFAGGDFFNGNEDFMKQFDFNQGGSHAYSFNFPDMENFGNSSSKIIIKKDGKKPLIIQDGEVVEGGDDYTKEEIEAFKKNNKVYQYDGLGQLGNLKGLEALKKLEFDTDRDNEGENLTKEELDKTKEEMIKAKEEMIKAKKEMEQAKKDLQKAKSTLKTQKA